jgi:hypothetical protein
VEKEDNRKKRKNTHLNLRDKILKEGALYHNLAFQAATIGL